MPMSQAQEEAGSSGSLHDFFQSNRPQPQPLAVSQEVRDRGSIFIAHAFAVTTVEEAQERIRYVKYVMHGSKRAAHEVAAWRCMTLKEGRTGLNGTEDFEVKSGSKDDGERWAGDKILKVMQNMAVIDAVVVVSRWFGGTLLGPARFTHIETCAADVCREFKRSDELRDCISSLTEMDGQLAELRSALAKLTEDSVVEISDEEPDEPIITIVSRKIDYSTLDLERGKRMLRAREGAVRSMKHLIAKRVKERASNPSIRVISSVQHQSAS